VENLGMCILMYQRTLAVPWARHYRAPALAPSSAGAEQLDKRRLRLRQIRVVTTWTLVFRTSNEKKRRQLKCSDKLLAATAMQKRCTV